MSYYIGPGCWIYFCCVPKDQPVGKGQSRICKDPKEYSFRGNLGTEVILVGSFVVCFGGGFLMGFLFGWFLGLFL